MSLTSLIALALAFAFQDPEAGADEIVRLRDGRLLVGAITRHDLDGLELVTARDGGRFQLGWSDLFPGEAERLKESFGYRDSVGEPLVAASRLLLRNGAEEVGIVLRRDERGLELRTREFAKIIPLAELAAPPEAVQVPATLVYTPAQFYAERAGQVPEDDAVAQFDFARELQSVFALEPARQHLEQARQLAQARGDQALIKRVEAMAGELTRLLAHREEAAYLEQVRAAMQRDRYAEAAALLEDYPGQYPNGALRADYLSLNGRFEERRADAMRRFLVRHWYNAVVVHLKRAALEREKGIDYLMDLATDEVPRKVREDLLAELQDKYQEDLALDQIDVLWKGRMSAGAKRHQAGYGYGSWILGEEKAREGLDPKKEEEQKGAGKSKEQLELEERTKRYLENLERERKRSQGHGNDEVTPEQWWLQAAPTERFQWLLAYYAEFSGDYEVTSASFDPCATCAGRGRLVAESLTGGGAGGGRVASLCPTCRGVGVRRAVTFR